MAKRKTKIRAAVVAAATKETPQPPSEVIEAMTEPVMPTIDTALVEAAEAVGATETTETTENVVNSERTLVLYRTRVVVTNDAADPVKTYYCWAPTQCAATKWIALQEEVIDFLMIEQLSGAKAITPEGAKVLSTTKDCGEFAS